MSKICCNFAPDFRKLIHNYNGKYIKSTAGCPYDGADTEPE